ncbi:hypothetical protein SOVF_015630 [Spinacia oleracea]|nr:hypothetical protein SOVF_015630 [Spinacia oleracea]
MILGVFLQVGSVPEVANILQFHRNLKKDTIEIFSLTGFTLVLRFAPPPFVPCRNQPKGHYEVNHVLDNNVDTPY